MEGHAGYGDGIPFHFSGTATAGVYHLLMRHAVTMQRLRTYGQSLHEAEVARGEIGERRKDLIQLCIGRTKPFGERRAILRHRGRRDQHAAVISVAWAAQDELG